MKKLLLFVLIFSIMLFLVACQQETQIDDDVTQAEIILTETTIMQSELETTVTEVQPEEITVGTTQTTMRIILTTQRETDVTEGTSQEVDRNKVSLMEYFDDWAAEHIVQVLNTFEIGEIETLTVTDASDYDVMLGIRIVNTEGETYLLFKDIHGVGLIFRGEIRENDIVFHRATDGSIEW